MCGGGGGELNHQCVCVCVWGGGGGRAMGGEHGWKLGLGIRNLMRREILPLAFSMTAPVQDKVYQL